MLPTSRAFHFSIFLYLVALQCNGGRLDPPTECKRTECPRYHLIHVGTGFEIRRYKRALWVSSPAISESSYLAGFGKGYFMLDDYYRGKNIGNVTIGQTYPIMIDVEADPDYEHNLTYTVYFYVPKKYQRGMPAPISPEIKPVKLPRRKYAAVRRFIYDEDNNQQVPEQVDALKKSLEGTPYQRAAKSSAFTLLFYKEDSNVREIVLPFDS